MRIRTGKDSAEAVKAAIVPESERELQRTSVTVTTDRDWLGLQIVAEDTTSLRSAVNSYMRWLKVAMDTANITKH